MFSTCRDLDPHRYDELIPDFQSSMLQFRPLFFVGLVPQVTVIITFNLETSRDFALRRTTALANRV